MELECSSQACTAHQQNVCQANVFGGAEI